MGNRLQPMTKDQVNILHTAAMRILNETGVIFKLPEAVQIFKSHGFKTEGEKVFFEAAQVCKALDSVPSEFTIMARNPEKSVRLGGDHFALGPAWAAPFVIDADGSRRNASMKDQENMCRLVQTSDTVDFAAGSMAVPAEFPPEEAATRMLHAAITMTDKPLISNPCARSNGREIADMAEIVWGRKAADLEHPVSIVSVNPLSPLSYAEDTLEGLIEFARNGQALLISSMVLAGITGPIDIPGTAAQEMAESLAGITLAQLIKPGVPCVCGGTSCASDMRTGGVSLGGPESLQLAAIAAQMAEHYGLPCRYGGNLTDAYAINAQAGFESALLMAVPMICGAHFIHQACGILGAYAAVSFEKFVMDEEICGMIKRALTPLQITDEIINTDLINRVGPSGSYMMQPETAMKCRTAFFQPQLTRRSTYDDWAAKNSGDLVARAVELVTKRIEAYETPDIDPGIQTDLDRYLNKNLTSKEKGETKEMATQTSSQMGTIAAQPGNPARVLEKFLGKIDHQLFWTTLVIFGMVVILGVTAPDKLAGALKSAQSFITTNFTWYYMLFTASCLVFSFWAAIGPFANLKLGKEEDEPEFSTMAWLAMLFSAGIGLGFIFWGIAEPLYHYMQTPYGAEPGTAEAVPVALQISYLHWGFHPWSFYAVGGLGIAYFSFRHDQPMTIATALYGLLGENTETSVWSKLTNLVTAFATIAGISTALGLGILSIKFGMTHITGLEMTPGITVLVLVLFMGAYIASSVSGLKRGLKYMSLINLWLAFAVIAFIFFAGPTRQLLNLFPDSLGHYLSNFVTMTFWSDSMNQAYDGKWLGWWTVFYWAFWIAWVPFVGGFIARISRGRTVREFILWVVLIPSVVMFVCFDIFGGAAILAERAGTVELWKAIQADMGSGIFTLLSAYPMGFFASIIIFISLIIFLITSADSASFLVAMLMSKGELEPRAGMKIVWGVVLGTLAIILLQTDGLKALQTASIVCALPFTVVMIAMMVSIVKGFSRDLTNR